MGYRRADEILPDEILKLLQKYVSGETIYVPSSKDARQRWGSNTGIREDLSLRNRQIWEEYQHGVTPKELAAKYYLTEKSIQRILRKVKTGPPMEEQSFT